MGQKHAFGLALALLAVSLSTLASADNPPASQMHVAGHKTKIDKLTIPAAEKVKLQPATLVIDTTHVMIRRAELTDQDNYQKIFTITVANPTKQDVDTAVVYRGKSTPVKAKAGADTKVDVYDKDPALVSPCGNIGRKSSFKLEGPADKVDTKDHDFEWVGTPTYEASGTAGHIAALLPDSPPQVEISDPVTADGGYVCGKKLKMRMKVANKTNKKVTDLKIKLTDDDGKNLGTQAIGPIDAKSSKIVEVETDGNVSGTVTWTGNPYPFGTVTAWLIDSGHELTASQIQYEGFVDYGYKSGYFYLKVAP